MIVPYGKIGRILAALLVTVCYWGLGAGLLLVFFGLSVTTVNFVWMGLFRPVFYLPAVLLMVYLFLFRKNKGLFLDSLMFLLALSLAVLWTIELVIFI
jgi:hypothetical protein